MRQADGANRVKEESKHVLVCEVKNLNEGPKIINQVGKLLLPFCKKKSPKEMEIQLLISEEQRSVYYGLVSAALALLGDINLAKTLIRNKADVNHQTRSIQRTALISCALQLDGKQLISANLALESLKFLIAEKAEVNHQEKNNFTALFFASTFAHSEAVRVLLEAKGDPKIGISPLADYGIKAKEEKNDLKALELLVNARADINYQDNDGQTPLAFFVHDHFLQGIKFLATQPDIKIDLPTKFGYSPLHAAIEAKTPTNIIECLLEHKATIDSKSSRLPHPPLMMAVYDGRADVVQLLLRYKANVNEICPTNFCTSIFIACQIFSSNIVKILIDAKADVNFVSKAGKQDETPFTNLEHFIWTLIEGDKAPTIVKDLQSEHAKHIELMRNLGSEQLTCQASELMPSIRKNGFFFLEKDRNKILRETLAIAKLLIEHKAETTIEADNTKRTVLMRTARNKRGGDQGQFIRFMTQMGSPVDDTNKTGETALSFAANYGSINCMEALIESKANVNHRNNQGATPLYLAAQREQIEAASLLIERKADPNLGKGFVPLHVAAGNSFIILALCEAKANVERESKDGKTALFFAAMQGNFLSILYLLIVEKANPLHRDNKGYTARHYIPSNKDKEDRPPQWRVQDDKGHETIFYKPGYKECTTLLETAEKRTRRRQWIEQHGYKMPVTKFVGPTM